MDSRTPPLPQRACVPWGIENWRYNSHERKREPCEAGAGDDAGRPLRFPGAAVSPYALHHDHHFPVTAAPRVIVPWCLPNTLAVVEFLDDALFRPSLVYCSPQLARDAPSLPSRVHASLARRPPLVAPQRVGVPLPTRGTYHGVWIAAAAATRRPSRVRGERKTTPQRRRRRRAAPRRHPPPGVVVGRPAGPPCSLFAVSPPSHPHKAVFSLDRHAAVAAASTPLPRRGRREAQHPPRRRWREKEKTTTKKHPQSAEAGTERWKGAGARGRCGAWTTASSVAWQSTTAVSPMVDEGSHPNRRRITTWTSKTPVGEASGRP